MHHRALAASLGRIDVDDPKEMAGRRHDGELTLGGLTALHEGELGNRPRRVPHLEEIGTHRGAAHRVMLRRRTVRQDDRLSARIMASYDSSGLGHRISPVTHENSSYRPRGFPAGSCAT